MKGDSTDTVPTKTADSGSLKKLYYLAASFNREVITDRWYMTEHRKYVTDHYFLTKDTMFLHRKVS